MSNIFISHSSKDKPFVRRLASALISEGFPVWLDSWNLSVGASLLDGIYDGIDKSSMVLLVVSKSTIESGWVNRELNAALSKEEQTGRKFLIPIKIDDCQSPIKVADRLYADFSKSFSAPLGKLVSALDAEGCRDLIVAPEKEQLSLNFTREVNLDRESLRKAIGHIQRRQGRVDLKPAQIVINEDADADALLEKLHARVDNISNDKFYSPELENGLRNSLSRFSENNRMLADGLCLFLANYPETEAIYWFARILRARNANLLYRMQSPESDILNYGKDWSSKDLGSNITAAAFFEVEQVSSIDFWRKKDVERTKYFHVWADVKDLESLRSYGGLPGDIGDIGFRAMDQFIYPQMIFQHLRDGEKRPSVIWNLNEASFGIH